MQGQDYGYYDADPTQPPDLSSLPHRHHGALGELPAYAGRHRDSQDSMDPYRYSYPSGPSRGSVYQQSRVILSSLLSISKPVDRDTIVCNTSSLSLIAH